MGRDAHSRNQLPRLQVDALAELFRRFDRADVSSRIGIADGIALLIPSRLGEDAPQLGLARVRELPYRDAPSCGAPGKSHARVGLLRARLPGGWLRPSSFLRRQGLFDRTQAADLSIHVDQLAGQGLKSAEFGDLLFRFAQGGLRRKILGSGFPPDLLCELKMRTVSRIIGLGAMAALRRAPSFASTAPTRMV
jgi:hypothetical protein